MIRTSELYKRLVRDPNRVYEHRATVGGVVYDNSSIVNAKIKRMQYESFSVGNCCAATLNLSFIKAEDPPKMAEIVVESRIRVGDEASEYIPRGTFYINTREESDGVLTVEAFDAVPKLEGLYFSTGEWEDQSMLATAQEIAGRIGIEIDSRTTVSDTYMVRYPGDMTMREVLCAIAAAHAGNWIVTAENKLLLIPLFSAPNETDYIVDEHGDAILIGGVRIRWR